MLTPCTCGNNRVYVSQVCFSGPLWAVCCDDCDAEGPARTSPDAASTAWDLKPGDDEHGRDACLDLDDIKAIEAQERGARVS